jgi:CheY-like chemotaxis protein
MAADLISHGSDPMASILIVDDEPPLRALLGEIAQSLGYHADVAADGPSALARFRAGVYDAVITDLVMPNMTGLEMARKIRRLDPPIAIIIVSGATIPVGEVREAFGIQFLSKPISIGLLTAALVQAVEQTGLAREPCLGPRLQPDSTP